MPGKASIGCLHQFKFRSRLHVSCQSSGGRDFFLYGSPSHDDVSLIVFQAAIKAGMVVLNGLVAIKPGVHLRVGDMVLVNDLPQPPPLEVHPGIWKYRNWGIGNHQKKNACCQAAIPTFCPVVIPLTFTCQYITGLQGGATGYPS